MRLIDLEPNWVGAGGEGVTRADTGAPVPARHGVGVTCRCPCGCDQRLYVPFSNPLDGGPNHDPPRGWLREGDTFKTLTLTPSIQRREPCAKQWHGFVTNGEIKTC